MPAIVPVHLTGGYHTLTWSFPSPISLLSLKHIHWGAQPEDFTSLPSAPSSPPLPITFSSSLHNCSLPLWREM